MLRANSRWHVFLCHNLLKNRNNSYLCKNISCQPCEWEPLGATVSRFAPVRLSMKRLLLLVTFLSALYVAKAQTPGDFDLSFGDNGILTVSPSANFNQARNFMVMPDGKIIVAGAVRVGNNNDMFLARLNPDGSYDTSFGDAGVIIYRPANFYAHYVDDIDMLGDKIIVAGYMFEPGTVPFFMCLNQNGSLNTDFAGGGFSAIDNGYAMLPRHMVVKNEMIYWSGYRNDICCVARFYPDGNIDSSFGENGFALTPLNDYLACNGEELVVLDNGKIIVAGWHNNYGAITTVPFIA